MDIHKPKAAHSWREFAIEIGTIITGILIALAAEQVVEARHWSHLVAEADRTLKAEIADQSRYYGRRVADAECVDARLDQIQALVGQLQAGRRVGVVPRIYAPSGALISRSAWSGLAASGVLAHFPPEQMLTYSALYAQANDFRDWEMEEGQTWHFLETLEGEPEPLSPAERIPMRVALIQARQMNILMRINSVRQLDRARSLGVPAPDKSPVPRVCDPLKLQQAR